MLLNSKYYSETMTDKAWYESSNVFYSEFIEDKNKNEGDLVVTFNNGSTYKYKDVQTQDYLLFKYGSLEGSHGKALNKHIKTKYEFIKLDNKDLNLIIEDKNQTIIEQQKEIKNKTYFISGHRNITTNEFEQYKIKINEILNNTTDALFVIGDYHGVDIMAQNYLMDDLCINPSQVTVYHMSLEPQNINPKISNTIGGFENDEERDSAMTSASSYDIAFVRDNTELSGTAQNILRRNLLKN